MVHGSHPSGLSNRCKQNPLSVVRWEMTGQKKYFFVMCACVRSHVYHDMSVKVRDVREWVLFFCLVDPEVISL